MTALSKNDWIEKLSLQQHVEGGFFRETYRSTAVVPTGREGGDRSLMTSIHYMLTDDHPIDHLHRNRSDILHYFQAGSPITYLTIDAQGCLRRQRLGPDPDRGEVLQLLVPAGHWKAAVLEGGEYGLIGEAVAPGFDYRDMTFAVAARIRSLHPDLWHQVAPYVRDGLSEPA